VNCLFTRCSADTNSELDHTTVYNYQNYAASEFKQISALGALTTADTIVQAIMKPPIAMIADFAGRAETYCGAVVFYIVSYILCASSNDFNQYGGGYVVYCVGATGMQILNQVIVADITSSRWRGLANSLRNLPFMVIPWASAFMSDSALRDGRLEVGY
jgi:MFS family permease